MAFIKKMVIGTDNWNLIKIDTSTAEYEILYRVNYKLESNWDGGWTGLSFNPADGNLYASGGFGDIFLINPYTGQRNWLAKVREDNNYSLHDLAFDNNGNLFVALQVPDWHYSIIWIPRLCLLVAPALVI